MVSMAGTSMAFNRYPTLKETRKGPIWRQCDLASELQGFCYILCNHYTGRRCPSFGFETLFDDLSTSGYFAHVRRRRKLWRIAKDIQVCEGW